MALNEFGRIIAQEVLRLQERARQPKYTQDAYDVQTVDLGTARSNVEVPWGGDYVLVENIDGELDIRFNRVNASLIELDKIRRVYTPFYRAYLTNSAQAGCTATIYIGKETIFEALTDLFLAAIMEVKSKTVLNAKATTGAGSTVDLAHIFDKHTWQMTLTGSPTGVDVTLQGSIDDSNWFELDRTTSTSAEMRHVVNKPVRYVRGYVTTLSGGTSPTVTVKSCHVK